MSFYKTAKFKKLQASWYKKLESEGFQDIEKTKNGEPQLKTLHSTYFVHRYTVDSFAFKRDFYTKLNEFLLYGKFDDDYEREVFTRYCGGASMRKIAMELKTKVCRIYKILRKYKLRMRGLPAGK